MTTTAIRQKLMTYVADADESKVKALYVLLEKDMEEDEDIILTPDQLDMVEKERQAHLNKQTKSYSRQEATEIIRGKRNF